MELEMFANSLDLYESVADPDTPHKLRHNSLLFIDEDFEDEAVRSSNNEQENDHVTNGNDDEEDDEAHSELSTSARFVSERIRRLYQHIVECLLDTQMHKEALLVTERQRTKHCLHLEALPELVSYEQIEKCLAETNVDSILYFSRGERVSKSNSSSSSSPVLHSWLIKRYEFIEYNEIDLSLVSGLFNFDNNFNELLTSSSEQERARILDEAYTLLFKPFEQYMAPVEPDSNEEKRLLCIVYDEQMLQVPFHLLREAASNGRFLYDMFEIDCLYSIKYLLFKAKSYSQRFTKNSSSDSRSSAAQIPMRTIANESDLARLLSVPQQQPPHKANTYQFDLVMIFISSDNRDLGLLNSLINNLMSKRITKAVLIQYSDVSGTIKNGENDEMVVNVSEEAGEGEDGSLSRRKQEQDDFERLGKDFIKTLYSKMTNRNSLTVIFN
jgi:hypothetical protein